MELGGVLQVGVASVVSGAICLYVQGRLHQKALKAVDVALAAVRAEMVKTKELSDARQRNFERELVRCGALNRENAELAEKLSLAQSGRCGFIPVGMTLYLN